MSLSKGVPKCAKSRASPSSQVGMPLDPRLNLSFGHCTVCSAICGLIYLHNTHAYIIIYPYPGPMSPAGYPALPSLRFCDPTPRLTASTSRRRWIQSMKGFESFRAMMVVLWSLSGFWLVRFHLQSFINCYG